MDRQAAQKHTSIIHGKWSHEETIATASFAEDYVIVKNMDEAEWVANFIINGGDRDEFLAKFENAGAPAVLFLHPHCIGSWQLGGGRHGMCFSPES